MEILRAAHNHRNILVFGKKQEAWNEVAAALNSNPIFSGCVRVRQAGRQAGSVRDELNGSGALSVHVAVRLPARHTNTKR